MNPTADNAPLARLLNVTKVFSTGGQDTHAMDNVSLDLFAGEMVVLLGPSGSGKTTLLTILAGLMESTAGNVILFDRSLISYTHASLQLLRATRVGFVFQTFLLLDALTVEENVTIVTEFVRPRRDGIKGETAALLHRLNIGHLARKHPHELSQGEKQRVAVARALINRPELIIADEPTASVDSPNGLEIIHLLHRLASSEHKCVLVASHDQRVMSYADRVIGMRDGRIAPAEAAMHAG
jgi:putative ABC transport system ATP-binding protein